MLYLCHERRAGVYRVGRTRRPHFLSITKERTKETKGEREAGRNERMQERPTDRTNEINIFDQDIVDAPSLNCFKNRPNKIRSTTMGFSMD